MKQAYSLSFLAGLSLALAFLQPGTWTAVLLGWFSAMALLRAMRLSENSMRVAYLCGLVKVGIVFNWLVSTISDFGNFPLWIAIPIYLLFVTTNSIHFILFAFLNRRLKLGLYLTAPVAFAVSEFIVPRIFPWQYSHTQMAFLPIVQIADIAGSISVTFLIFWVASAIEEILSIRKLRLTQLAPVLGLVASLIYGVNRIETIKNTPSRNVEIALVQGNIPIEAKHQSSLQYKNFELYLKLSERFFNSDRLVIWPETVLVRPVSEKLSSTQNHPWLKNLALNTNWLIGSLTYENKDIYNSVLAIDKNGAISKPDHKRILMPFGEYIPFSKTFPWLLDAAHMAGEISPGTELSYYSFMDSKNEPYTVTPLNCYEDILNTIARKATKNGADLLVNVTNDAWFGKSTAPFQHHLLASMRAIENRRTLLRATNTGLTAVVLPTGETSDMIPVWTHGTIEASVPLAKELSIYTKYIGDNLWWALSLISLLIVFRNRHK
ncbi:MAG: apolipoprotein N-acyltransferase [Deltaproteobacteria bacterium]|nr:apolipoprotein N-acyltransferase [Deltaproteobacteria bacterium]